MTEVRHDATAIFNIGAASACRDSGGTAAAGNENRAVGTDCCGRGNAAAGNAHDCAGAGDGLTGDGLSAGNHYPAGIDFHRKIVHRHLKRHGASGSRQGIPMTPRFEACSHTQSSRRGGHASDIQRDRLIERRGIAQQTIKPRLLVGGDTNSIIHGCQIRTAVHQRFGHFFSSVAGKVHRVSCAESIDETACDKLSAVDNGTGQNGTAAQIHYSAGHAQIPDASAAADKDRGAVERGIDCGAATSNRHPGGQVGSHGRSDSIVADFKIRTAANGGRQDFPPLSILSEPLTPVMPVA